MIITEIYIVNRNNNFDYRETYSSTKILNIKIDFKLKQHSNELSINKCFILQRHFPNKLSIFLTNSF